MADRVTISSLAPASGVRVLAFATLPAANAPKLRSDKWPSANLFTIDF